MNLRFLWLIKLDHHPRMRHGNSVIQPVLGASPARSRDVLRINRHPRDELPGRRAYLEELREEESRACRGRLPSPAGFCAQAICQLIPRSSTRCYGGTGRLREPPRRRAADRRLCRQLPNPPVRGAAWTGTPPVVIDWTDSYVLHGLRTPIFRGASSRCWPADCARPAGSPGPALLHPPGERQPVVSPVDKRCMDVVTGVPSKVRVFNGIEMEAQALAVKEPGH